MKNKYLILLIQTTPPPHDQHASKNKWITEKWNLTLQFLLDCWASSSRVYGMIWSGPVPFFFVHEMWNELVVMFSFLFLLLLRDFFLWSKKGNRSWMPFCRMSRLDISPGWPEKILNSVSHSTLSASASSRMSKAAKPLCQETHHRSRLACFGEFLNPNGNRAIRALSDLIQTVYTVYKYIYVYSRAPARSILVNTLKKYEQRGVNPLIARGVNSRSNDFSHWAYFPCVCPRIWTATSALPAGSSVSSRCKDNSFRPSSRRCDLSVQQTILIRLLVRVL